MTIIPTLINSPTKAEVTSIPTLTITPITKIFLRVPGTTRNTSREGAATEFLTWGCSLGEQARSKKNPPFRLSDH